jgi:hypothetical protein
MTALVQRNSEEERKVKRGLPKEFIVWAYLRNENLKGRPKAKTKEGAKNQ